MADGSDAMLTADKANDVEAHLMWHRARQSDELSRIKPMRLFHWSNMYLSLLFVAVALDPLLTR